MSLRIGERSFVAQFPQPNHQFSWLKVAEPQLPRLFHLSAQVGYLVMLLAAFALLLRTTFVACLVQSVAAAPEL